MSELTGNSKRAQYLVAQVAQAVGDYYVLLKDYEVAREEYQEAMSLYSQVQFSDLDYPAAQQNCARVGKALENLEETVNSSQDLLGHSLINLGQWLENNFTEAVEAGWQALDAILPQRTEPTYGYARGAFTTQSKSHSVKRAKIIYLNSPLDHQSVALALTLQPEENQAINVLAQVFSLGETAYLPLGLNLKVTLYSESSQAESNEIVSTGEEAGLQLEFSELSGKLVEVEVTWKNLVKVEKFVI